MAITIGLVAIIILLLMMWQDVMDKASGFWGVYKGKKGKAKPSQAKIQVTEDGKSRTIKIARFAREEDAARAFDRVSIAYHGHAKAKTNFPVEQYRADLRALGVDTAVARERRHAQRL